jgi:hypothetical protein
MTQLLSAADIASMKADVELVIASNPTSVELRREEITLEAQTVLIARRKAITKTTNSEVGEETRGGILILGDIDLDIQREDRFNVNGSLYRVTSVRPEYQICVQAEAEVIE